jgi:hypothetical protein
VEARESKRPRRAVSRLSANMRSVKPIRHPDLDGYRPARARG